jgi:PIN domain nuclease of toxin-antitoxin system
MLDTHVWAWWVGDPALLSAKARSAIARAIQEDKVRVSAISAWEVAILVKRGRMKLTMDVRDWIARSEALPFFQFVPVSARIAVESVGLTDFPCARQQFLIPKSVKIG